MFTYRIIFLLLQLGVISLCAQNSVKGVVITESKKGKLEPVPFANVYWMNTNYGTSTDSAGTFQLAIPENPTLLIASFVGYQSDTTVVEGFSQPITLQLKSSLQLNAVEVTSRRKSTEMSFINPMKMENLSERELFKAACCNLSESFETNPSVDVNFTDAVTGVKQIHMLGLDGPYTMISRENMPGIRGLGNAYGLTFIPGTWISSIQVTKGVGSVVNGYESIAGQINTELKKPDEGDEVFLNLFASQAGRTEFNFVNTLRLSEKWGTTLLLHGNYRPWERDRNQDGFREFPLQEQINLMNRWKYFGTRLRAQLGLQFVQDEKEAGQTDQAVEDAERIQPQFEAWRMNVSTRKAEAFAKVGLVYPEFKYRSMGLQLSANFHEQNSTFGRTAYDAEQRSGYANYIYQSILGDTRHKFKTGLSFLYDEYNEVLDSNRFERLERVPGSFFEYTFAPNPNLTVVAGIRADYHNLFGAFVTPRLHFRYAYDEQTVFRLLGGSGQRTANIFAEHQAMFATSRQITLHGNRNLPYGLQAERAWNFGLNLTRDFRLAYREGYVSIDLYRTDFEQQVVYDLYQSADQVLFYNLNGESYSNSFQAEISYELIKFLDMRLAYRWLEVRTDYLSGKRQKPFVPRHRLFANFAYETQRNLKNANWMFDLTAQWIGEQEIPGTESNPIAFQRPDRSPSFSLFNTQITRNFNKKWSVYAGLENIFDFRQDQPIVDPSNPFGNNFDAALVWGPIFGRMIYGGVRFRIKDEK